MTHRMSKESLFILRSLARYAWDLTSNTLQVNLEDDPKAQAVQAAYLEVDRELARLLDDERMLNYGAYVVLDDALHSRTIETIGNVHGPQCENCGHGYGFGIYQPFTPTAIWLHDSKICPRCGGEVINSYRIQILSEIKKCSHRGCMEWGDERDSMGVYAGRYCEGHYKTAFPFRKVGREAFDASYAGESYEEV